MIMMKRILKQPTLLETLESNLGELPKFETELAEIRDVFSKIEKDTEDDYVYIRKKIKFLIEKAETAIENLSLLADDAEHPRAYEVLSTMIHQTSVMIERLLDIQNKRKKLHQKEEQKTADVPGKNGNTFIFNGTTTDLQKMISNARVTE